MAREVVKQADFVAGERIDAAQCREIFLILFLLSVSTNRKGAFILRLLLGSNKVSRGSFTVPSKDILWLATPLKSHHCLPRFKQIIMVIHEISMVYTTSYLYDI